MKTKQKISPAADPPIARAGQKGSFAAREPPKTRILPRSKCLAVLAEKIYVDAGPVSLRRYRKETSLIDAIMERASSIQLPILLQALELSDHARDPDAYLNFLARPDLDLPAFLDSIGTFTPTRHVVFHEIRPEIREIRDKLVWLIREARDHGAARVTCLAYELLRHPSGRFQMGSREAIFEAYLATSHLIGGLVGDAYSKYFPEISDLLSHCVLSEIPTLVVREDLGLAVSHVDDYVTIGDARGDVNRDTRRYIRKTYPLPYSHNFSSGAAKGFVVTDDEYFLAQNSVGFCQRYRLFIPETIHRDSDTFSFVFNHELQHLFDNLIGLGAGSADQSEYRATLSEFAFHDPLSAPCALSGMKNDLLGRYDSKSHELARRRVVREFTAHLHAKSSLWTPPDLEVLPGFAKARLDNAYKEAVGLTYSEILEPFGRLKQVKARSIRSYEVLQSR